MSAARRVAPAALERAGLDGSRELVLLGIGGDSTSFGSGLMVVSVRRLGDVARILRDFGPLVHRQATRAYGETSSTAG